MGGRGSASSRGSNKAGFATQTLKLTQSRFGNTTYESELFKLSKYSHNSAGSNYKESGYRLSIKGQYTRNEVKFDTLKQAKSWINTQDAQKWYRENKKK